MMAAVVRGTWRPLGRRQRLASSSWKHHQNGVISMANSVAFDLVGEPCESRSRHLGIKSVNWTDHTVHGVANVLVGSGRDTSGSSELGSVRRVG